MACSVSVALRALSKMEAPALASEKQSWLGQPTPHISDPSEIVECAEDQEAIEKTKQFVDGHDGFGIEVALSCGFLTTR
jgi:hypothetical protein